MDTQYFKNKLEEEQALLEEEIQLLGVVADGDHNFDLIGESGVDNAESIELADSFALEAQKEALLDQLENRLIDVLGALNKIKNNTFGICEVSGREIEKERLEANPAARTNIANREVRLN
jgi:RNA polymerase-binding transcription factor DksA